MYNFFTVYNTTIQHYFSRIRASIGISNHSKYRGEIQSQSCDSLSVCITYYSAFNVSITERTARRDNEAIINQLAAKLNNRHCSWRSHARQFDSPQPRRIPPGTNYPGARKYSVLAFSWRSAGAGLDTAPRTCRGSEPSARCDESRSLGLGGRTETVRFRAPEAWTGSVTSQRASLWLRFAAWFAAR